MTAPHPIAQALIISVRYVVSGPIKAVDTAAGAMLVAGQRVMVLPTTWVASRFGTQITVSGLRQSDRGHKRLRRRYHTKSPLRIRASQIDRRAAAKD